jgi:DNA-binding NarL/FixJ family response regulator
VTTTTDFHLTRRESDVAQLLVHGMPNKLIARDLCISTRTVKGHLSEILRKTEAQSRTEAAVRLALASRP